MAVILHSVEIDVPVSEVYDLWTQWELFGTFMKSVSRVRCLRVRHLHWRARIFGRVLEWQAEISEKIPGKRIAWRSTAGAANQGVVTFHRVATDRTRLMLFLEYRPRTWLEKIGTALGIVRGSVLTDLRSFAHFIEIRGEASVCSRTRIERASARAGQPMWHSRPDLHLVRSPSRDAEILPLQPLSLEAAAENSHDNRSGVGS